LFRRFSVSDIRNLCKGIEKEDCTAGKLEEKNPQLSQQLLAMIATDAMTTVWEQIGRRGASN
jgi:hypothetical protein